MLLVADISNTNITIGAFNGANLVATFRITTKIQRTSDEFGMLIFNLLNSKNINHKEIGDVIISSVVPDVMHSFENCIIKYFGHKPIIVGPGIKTGIKMITGNAREIGADRIVDAVGAYELYGGPVIVIDFGTATTYDYITSDGAFAAGRAVSGGCRRYYTCDALFWQPAAAESGSPVRNPSGTFCVTAVSALE